MINNTGTGPEIIPEWHKVSPSPLSETVDVWSHGCWTCCSWVCILLISTNCEDSINHVRLIFSQGHWTRDRVFHRMSKRCFAIFERTRTPRFSTSNQAICAITGQIGKMMVLSRDPNLTYAARSLSSCNGDRCFFLGELSSLYQYLDTGCWGR